MVLRVRLTDHRAVIQEAEDTLAGVVDTREAVAEAVTLEVVTPEGADNLDPSKHASAARGGGV
jgi:uncharacterized iron-regulated protein